MSLAVTRTRSPSRSTEPSTTAETRSSRAMSGTDFIVSRYRRMLCREIAKLKGEDVEEHYQQYTSVLIDNLRHEKEQLQRPTFKHRSKTLGVYP